MAGTVNIAKAAPRYRGLRMTADAYLALEPDGFRYELVAGVVRMSPSPTPRHQRIAAEVMFQIAAFVRARDLGVVLAEVDVRLDDDLVYRPDLVYLSRERAAGMDERITVAPDLVVEVVSADSRAHDARTKRDDYERCGVGEYWLIDPQRDAFLFLRLAGGRFVAVPVEGDAYDAAVIPGLRLDLAAIRAVF